VADDGTHGPELWKSNGSPAGTVLVKDIYPGLGGSTPDYLTNVSGVVRREWVSIFSGSESHPARVVPAGSNRSGDGGNEIAGAFDGEGRLAVLRADRP
jgi:ELWxxDGT repeat protein